MKTIIILLLFLSLGACVTTKPKDPSLSKIENHKNTREIASRVPLKVVVALKKRDDGSYCQIDMRGNSNLTPAFVRSASYSVTSPTNKNVSVCSSKERKAFQKTLKKSYLAGSQAKKTNLAGAVIGTVAKSAGIGCIFGSGFAWVMNLFSGDHNDGIVKAGTIILGATVGDAVGYKSFKSILPAVKVAEAKKILITSDTNRMLQAIENPEYAKSKLAFVESEILDLRNRQAQRGLDPNSSHNLAKEEARMNSAKSFWNRVIELQESAKKPGSVNAKPALAYLVEQEVTKRVINLPDKTVIAKLNDMPRQHIKVKVKFNKPWMKLKFNEGTVGGFKSMLFAKSSGMAGGIAGAIVCEDGTTYVLSDDPKTDM